MPKDTQKGLQMICVSCTRDSPGQAQADINIPVPKGMLLEIWGVELSIFAFQDENAGDKEIRIGVCKNQNFTVISIPTLHHRDWIAFGVLSIPADATSNVSGVDSQGLGFRAFPHPILDAKGELRLVMNFWGGTSPLGVICMARIYYDYVKATDKRILEVVQQD